MRIQDLYTEWCKETKRTGSVLVGGSIKEFFEWLDDNEYYITRPVQYSESFIKSIESIENALRR